MRFAFLVPKVPLGNRIIRSSASRRPVQCVLRQNPKRSFDELRSQAELGNETGRALS
jgi:hypothetical protein